jgi:2,5-dihydroxypyridine 5,6-dioxygenase
MPYDRSFSTALAAVDLVDLFARQFEACRLKRGEFCALVTDTAWNPVYAAAALGACKQLGAEASLTTFSIDGDVPARALGAVCAAADLIVYMSFFTLHYRSEVRAALDRGARALCVMQPLHVLRRLSFDAEVRRRALAGAALLDQASAITITTPAGTRLAWSKAGRRGLASYGAADAPGRLDFWGGGMVQAAPIEGTAEGRLVLDVGDVCFMLARFVESRVAITFEEGRIVAIEGGLDAKLLRHAIEAAGEPEAFMAGHMAWGVDHRALWLAPTIDTPDQGGGGADSEGFYGNVQVEIGSNDDILFGGRNRSKLHMGLCMLGASLSLDGAPVIEGGRFVIPELV